jgi:hypothetical protein
MTSARKIKANRANARASTGPKTVDGKARVAQNAHRHGLSLSVLADPTLSKEVETLALEIAGKNASAEIKDHAHRIAEVQIDLIRVRRARYDLLSGKLSDPKYESPHAILKKEKLVAAIARQIGPFTPIPPELLDAFNAKPEDPQKLMTILSDVTKKLAAMDRYERRALSRRKFAIRDFDMER